MIDCPNLAREERRVLIDSVPLAIDVFDVPRTEETMRRNI
jgi:hypothetical protein